MSMLPILVALTLQGAAGLTLSSDGAAKFGSAGSSSEAFQAFYTVLKGCESGQKEDAMEFLTTAPQVKLFSNAQFRKIIKACKILDDTKLVPSGGPQHVRKWAYDCLEGKDCRGILGSQVQTEIEEMVTVTALLEQESHSKVQDLADSLFSQKALSPNPDRLVGALLQQKERIQVIEKGKKPGKATPQIGMSLPVHPPKFYMAEQFLEQYAACPAAQDAMSLSIVFSNERDAGLFQSGLKKRRKDQLSSYFKQVIVPPHERKSEQNYAAYKKWYGVTDMMDSPNPPKYGLLVDSELTLFNEKDCGANSEWTKLLGRIEAREASKEWYAAEVVDAKERSKEGRATDKIINRNNFHWVNRATNNECKYKDCDKIEEHIQNGRFSWWTDLPFVNLKVVGKMLPAIANKKVPQDVDTYCNLAKDMHFSRYEHIGYQMWTVLHEGWSFKDVTDVVGASEYGAYSEEDPAKHPRVHELKPMWTIRGRTQQAEDAPPVLNFHDDKFPGPKRDLTLRFKARNNWRDYLEENKVDLHDTAGPGKMS